MIRRCVQMGMLALVLGLPVVASATNILRLEAVGAVPIRAGERATVAPKQAAIQAALREAVSRVAHDFLLDAEPGSTSEPPRGSGQQLAALYPVLGNDMVRYTTSFRILEDRGERPALFVEDPQAATEYVVIVEVHVDADRVESRLVDAGLLARRAPEAPTGKVRLEVLGLHQYAAYEAVRAILVDGLGARGVSPLEMERGRSVLMVETELAPAELLHRLLAQAPPNMEISPLAAESDSVRLSVYWTPPPAPDAEDAALAAPGEVSGSSQPWR